MTVEKGNIGFGLINTKGELISKDDYGFITHFSCDLAIDSKGITCEFLNEKGKVAVPGKFIFARPFKKYSNQQLFSYGGGLYDKTY